MINYEAISATVAAIKRKYQENDLFRLCAYMGIQVVDLDTPMSAEDFKGMYLGSNVRLATDNDGQLVLLFPDEWAVNYFAEKNEDITLIKHSPLQGDTI